MMNWVLSLTNESEAFCSSRILGFPLNPLSKLRDGKMGHRFNCSSCSGGS